MIPDLVVQLVVAVVLMLVLACLVYTCCMCAGSTRLLHPSRRHRRQSGSENVEDADGEVAPQSCDTVDADSLVPPMVGTREHWLYQIRMVRDAMRERRIQYPNQYPMQPLYESAVTSILQAYYDRNHPSFRADVDIDMHRLTVPDAIGVLACLLSVAAQWGRARVVVDAGRGLHSAAGRAVLQPSVERWLQNNGYSFTKRRNSGIFEVDTAYTLPHISAFPSPYS